MRNAKFLLLLLISFTSFNSCELIKDEPVEEDPVLIISGSCENTPNTIFDTYLVRDSVTVIYGLDQAYFIGANWYLDGSGYIEFQRDSTYSLIYNFSVEYRSSSKKGINVYEKDEHGRFTYNYEINFGGECNGPYDPLCLTAGPTTGSGVITFHPDSGGSWSAPFFINLSYDWYFLAIAYESDTLVLSMCNCFRLEE